ncbi:histidine kinase [Winogradskyella tangerina]|uniref:histidine kinase n=1 Tax=Winogradskyella tangerina TaxID=2023240 RepID=UPI000DBE3D24|nr:histidine kinase [Winogradskyella tangerina]
MKAFRLYILLICVIGLSGLIEAQDKNTSGRSKLERSTEDVYFTIRGTVYDKKTYEAVPKVSIQVNGSKYTTSDSNGKFSVRARVGDELIITHSSFDPIYHIVESNDRIYIEVQQEQFNKFKTSRSFESRKVFNRHIDSADYYLKKDAEKSIKFVGDALNVNTSTVQSGEAHELLGDIYIYWKQYDLAITAFKISLQNYKTNSARLKLANAYLKNDDFEKSIQTYSEIDEKTLSNYEKTMLYEGMGDAYLEAKNFDEAVASYEKGLSVAKEHLITPKITDLNSKIAQAYNFQGNIQKAKGFFDSSLDLATKENKKRAVEEQIKVAEFNSAIEDYDSEIELRKQALESIEDIKLDSVIPNESALTPQKQNYKLGNAYLLNNDLENAIPSFRKSIEEADKNADLDVKKDATRKLSEALIDAGNIEEGRIWLDEYKKTVDELYAKKIQEISRAAHFSRSIAEQQNRITSLESDRQLSLKTYELTEEQNKRQKLIIYSLVGGLVLFLITGFMMFKYIRQQRFANNLLALKSLRSQMNPHFIFNALNSVNSFIATNDERTANKYLSDFSHLMRSVLENSEEDFIPLKKEMELLELYTKLEHFRFQDKFEYSINIDDKINVEEFLIPPMLLQPYIENAVWHGLRYKAEKGHLNISVNSKSKNEIEIIVTDDGIGRQRSKALKTSNQKKQKSKGMDNIKQRVSILNEMYKDKVDVSIADFRPNEEDTGTKVVVTLKKV